MDTCNKCSDQQKPVDEKGSQMLRALMVEDSEDDGLIIQYELKRAGFGSMILQRVQTAQALHEALAAQAWDVILSDYSLPGLDGAEALAICQSKGLDIPFIVVSGAIGEELAVQMMKSGAHDYVMKNSLFRLPSAVRREIAAAHERKLRRQAESSMAYLAAIVESCEDAVIGKTPEGVVTSWNRGAERLYGYTAEEMIGRSISIVIPASRVREFDELKDLLTQNKRLEAVETVRIRKDGTLVDVALTISPIKDADGRLVGASTIARDISQRKEAERARLRLIDSLREALERVKTLSGLLPICSDCKRIRNDAGYWQAVEIYVKEHSEAEFTHGICPDCAQEFMREHLAEAQLSRTIRLPQVSP